MKQYKVDIDHIIRHYDVTGKSCPGIVGWNDNTGSSAKWLQFKKSIAEEEEEVTQEQFNSMMKVYLTQIAQQDPTWDKSACEWAVEKGLMKGDDQGRLMSKKLLTRGEVVTMLQRFWEMIK